ncbi:MAG TPA: T9SS type A sorting domain-containing protein [Saprospiraceae bacterium]|nr:T9SS type A sorting domain-containing protein [Saprospiraceae bacterium]
MRKPLRSHALFYGLLLPMFMHLLYVNHSPKTALPENSRVVADIVGCAGNDTRLEICTFCSDIDMEINFMERLDGQPRSGGVWTDLDNSGLDISDSTRVDVAGLNTGIYRFRYNTSAQGACPDDSAVLSLDVTGANTIACVDRIEAQLGADCAFELMVDQVLSGSAVCEDELSVLAFDFATGFNGSVLTESQVGKELDVVLFKQGCAVPLCNTTIFLQDRGAPSISDINWLGDDYTLYCEDMNRIVNNPRSWEDPSYKYYLGAPLINDCSGFFVSVTDNVIYEPCGTNEYATLQRTFIITDAAGNFSSTTLDATFIYPDLSQIAKLPDLTISECDPNGVAVPDTYPYLINAFGDTIYLKEDGCNYSIGFEDRDFFVCGGARKIEREVRYFDWCTDQFYPIDTLVIKIGDFSGPVIERQVDTANIPTSPFGCGGAISLQREAIELLFDVNIRDCNPNVRVSGKVESWDAQTNTYQSGVALHHDTYIDQIPAGLNRFIISMEDGCKGQSVDTLYFRTIDQIPPVMSCIDRLIVSMSEGPYAKVGYVDINEGSSDNCAITSFKVRRQVAPEAYEYYDYDGDGQVLGDELDENGYTRFDDLRSDGDYVEYYCNDLLQPEQPVELWGWDAYGNMNTCWATVLLEDKLPPVCIAPKDTVVACYDYVPTDLSPFGTAEASDYSCGDLLIEELPAIHSTNQCGQGTILRRFQATKNPNADQPRLGPICVQTIRIEAIHDYSICFPADTSLECGLELAQMEPELNSNGCALFAVSFEDIRLETENAACYKLIRTYSVINWCEYQKEDPFIHIERDVNDDNIPGNLPVCVVVKPGDSTFLDSNTNPYDTLPDHKGYYYGSQSNPNLRSTGYWKYTQHIQVRDTTPPALSFPDSLVFESRYATGQDQCFGLATIPFTIEETCDTFIDLSLSLDLNAQGEDFVPLSKEYLFGDFPNYELMTEFPIGNHQLRIRANDGCGNTSIVHIPFEVIDKKAPAPICGDMLAVELSFWETDDTLTAIATARVDALLRSPVYDCNGQGENGLVTDYSINRSDSRVVRGQRELSFGCADADRFIEVEIYAWDEMGNHDYCTTYIHVQDNRSVCEQLANAGMISGSIQTPDGDRVEEVMVALSGEMNAMYATTSTGDFIFESLPSGKNYQVRPTKDDDPRNGVSTLDLIKVQKHVLGITPIINPYRLIAADVNNSKSVTTLDMIQLRKIILNIDDHFRNNTSWRFVEANYEFPDRENPWMEAFPETIRVEDMKGPADIHFVGVKIGDVNGNATANQLQGSTVSRSAGQLNLFIREQALSDGEVLAVPISVKELDEIDGLQGTLSFDTDKLRFLTMNYGLLQSGQIGHFETDRRLSFSWNRAQEKEWKDEEVLVTIYFQAKKNLYLSNAIQLNSSLTQKEAYNIFGEYLDVNLVFEQVETSDSSWNLFTNRPNPFRGQTTFPFYLEKENLVKVAIYDLQGRRVWSGQEQRSAGLQQWTVSASLFPAKGLYYFRMEIDGQERTKPILFE